MEAVRDIKRQDGMERHPYGSSKEHGKERRKYRVIVGIFFGIFLLASLYLIAYTPVNDWFHSMRMKRIISNYDQAVVNLAEAEREEILESARAYNAECPEGTHFFPSEEELDRYNAQLDITGTGMMGYIQISKIGVSLPIYHTTDEDVLAEAVGHIPGSSLPVGGDSCHTVLCGHRDLSTAYLFYNLDKLEAGDTFTLTVLDETITYEVDQVHIVLPQQIEDLAIEDGKDYCTLVTCHPYGSSEYRMLVRGKRVYPDDARVSAE